MIRPSPLLPRRKSTSLMLCLAAAEAGAGSANLVTGTTSLIRLCDAESIVINKDLPSRVAV